MKYRLVFAPQAVKDMEKVAKSNLKDKVYKLLASLEEDPLRPPLEKLFNVKNTYSKRINLQHRLVYQIVENNTVKILRVWTHYGDN